MIGDPAYIDVQYWCLQKIRRQAVIITREKENMKPMVIGANPFDPDDPVNRGVEADETAGYTTGHLRRIRYRDPATGERFIFLPTNDNLRPGLIALLYLLRWKIEKIVSSQRMVRHAGALTCQFIRLVRHCLRRRTSWADALPLFRLRLEAYL